MRAVVLQHAHGAGEENVSRPVSRVLSGDCSPRRPFIWDDARASPRCNQPGRRSGTRLGATVFPRARPPLFGLAPGGVCHATSVARRAVRSYRTISPLPWFAEARRGGLISVALSLGSPPAAVSRHRGSMEPGLSSAAGCIATTRGRRQRPPGRLTRRHKGLCAGIVKGSDGGQTFSSPQPIDAGPPPTPNPSPPGGGEQFRVDRAHYSRTAFCVERICLI